MKILIIEDEPALRELIQRSLEKERYVVEVASDFYAGLDKIDYITFSNSGDLQPLDEKRIFERFYQGKKKEGTTGLGLAIVAAICRQCSLAVSYRFVNNMHEFHVTNNK